MSQMHYFCQDCAYRALAGELPLFTNRREGLFSETRSQEVS